MQAIDLLTDSHFVCTEIRTQTPNTKVNEQQNGQHTAPAQKACGNKTSQQTSRKNIHWAPRQGYGTRNDHFMKCLMDVKYVCLCVNRSIRVCVCVCACGLVVRECGIIYRPFGWLHFCAQLNIVSGIELGFLLLLLSWHNYRPIDLGFYFSTHSCRVFTISNAFC